MKAPIRALAALATVLALVLAGTAPAEAATDRGFTWLSVPVGLAPNGLKVFVARGSHTSAMVAATKYAIAQQRKYGIRVRWSGLTNRQGYPTGAVVVHQTTDCSGAEAGRGSDRWMPTNVPGVAEVYTGNVALCGTAFAYGASALRVIVMHELGHVVGLGHYTSRYMGHLQVMYPVAQPADRAYRAGDVNGLRAIARNTVRLAKG